ncbi:2OG-Fe(II) oxygenase [Xanthomonas sacchari]|uniref:2OG-Fe(II) oxygenase n=1 Tax=Xanthomonas sacchari TaxID=56458 RepID=A0A2P5Z8R1_9XANT|nr:2OG-Fe(II) oxygenase [Xanthomonas sacchari]MDV0437820.1 2OG-Fe(II) oxygenase [Xanthomonas sacchari]PPU85035.1 2OG-Fe(II) oxygenase [Xanthomonas sacchari]
MKALSDYIRTYDDALPVAFCQQLIEGFEASRAHHLRNGSTLHAALSESNWTELDIGKLADPAFLGFFLDRIEHYLACYNQELGLTLPIPYRPTIDRLILKKYQVGGVDRFQPHFDAVDAVSERYLVFLWYLNDVGEGGTTRFCDLDVETAPRAGRLLMFPPYWMYQHVGEPPVSNDKYILSTYLMFKR